MMRAVMVVLAVVTLAIGGDCLPQSERTTSSVANSSLKAEAERLRLLQIQRALRKRLPEIRKQVREVLQSLGDVSIALSFMPERVKVALAKREMSKHAAEVNLFLSLPAEVQERILVHLLARHPEADDVVLDNEAVIAALGLSFDVSHIVEKARSLRKRLP